MPARCTLMAFCLLVCPTALRAESSLGSAGLMLNAHAALLAGDEEAASHARFGEAGSWYWTLVGGVAFQHDSTDGNLYAGLGVFLTDRFEFNFGVGGWYFWQEGENTAGGNPAFGFRYHFAPREPVDFYIDTGIGLLFSGDDVPEDGESVNFTPRAGVGALFRLGDEPDAPRLDLGIRWHHISTASTTGSDDNPSRDSAMVYLGVVFPF